MNNELQDQYKALAKSFKELKNSRETVLQELAEAKGNKAAYERERDEYIAELKKYGLETKNLKSQISNMIEKLAKDIEKDKKLCDDLEDIKIG